MGEDNVTHLWTEWLDGVAEAPTWDRPWNVRRMVRSMGLRSSRREEEKPTEKRQEGHSVLSALTEEVTGFRGTVSSPCRSSWSVLSLWVWLYSLSLWAVEPTCAWKTGANPTGEASWKLSWRLWVSRAHGEPLSLHLRYSSSSQNFNSTNQDIHRELNLVLFTKKSNTTKRVDLSIFLY